MGVAMYKSGSKSAQRGVAAIEMAITLPFLLMLLLATAEFGRAFFQYNTLTKSVQTGVRFLADNAKDGFGLMDLTNDKRTAVKNLVVYGNTAGGSDPLLPGLDLASVTVSQLDASHIEVAVSFVYQPMFARIPTFGLGSPDIDTGLSLSAAATMRAI